MLWLGYEHIFIYAAVGGYDDGTSAQSSEQSFNQLDGGVVLKKSDSRIGEE